MSSFNNLLETICGLLKSDTLASQAELVAREAENLETLVPILTVQLSELSEVKSGQASSASKIADKNCLLFLEEGSELRMHFAIHILNRLIEDVLNW